MHLGMSYETTRKLPVIYRKWFLNRLASEFRSRADASRAASRSSSDRNIEAEIPMGEAFDIIERKF
jgi:hypothetical protein